MSDAPLSILVSIDSVVVHRDLATGEPKYATLGLVPFVADNLEARAQGRQRGGMGAYAPPYSLGGMPSASHWPLTLPWSEAKELRPGQHLHVVMRAATDAEVASVRVEREALVSAEAEDQRTMERAHEAQQGAGLTRTLEVAMEKAAKSFRKGAGEGFDG